MAQYQLNELNRRLHGELERFRATHTGYSTQWKANGPKDSSGAKKYIEKQRSSYKEQMDLSLDRLAAILTENSTIRVSGCGEPSIEAQIGVNWCTGGILRYTFNKEFETVNGYYDAGSGAPSADVTVYRGILTRNDPVPPDVEQRDAKKAELDDLFRGKLDYKITHDDGHDLSLEIFKSEGDRFGDMRVSYRDDTGESIWLVKPYVVEVVSHPDIKRALESLK